MSEGLDPAVLEDVKLRIRRCPYPLVSEAIMRINGEFVQGPEYNLCLEALLSGGYLTRQEKGFLINRRLLPRIEVKSRLDIPLVWSRPVERREVPEVRPAVRRSIPAAPVSEPPPNQWELF